MDTAQLIFKDWTKEQLAPALRSLGFKGSGQSFTLPDADCWALLGVQKSTSSSADLVKFTLNLSVANRQLWVDLRNWEHYWMAARPSANSQSPGQTMRRIGSVLPNGQDKWWSIATGASSDSLGALSAEIESAVREFGLPELQRLIEANRLSKVQDRLNSIKRVRPRPAHLK